MRSEKKYKRIEISSHALKLACYDAIVLGVVALLLLAYFPSSYYKMGWEDILWHYLLSLGIVLGCRSVGGSYRFVWRYGGSNLYINLIACDVIAGGLYFVVHRLLPLRDIEFLRVVTLIALNLLGAIAMRQLYQYLYDANSRDSRLANFLRVVTQKLTGIRVEPEEREDRRIHIAIIGAGRVGAGLAADLTSNPAAAYSAKFFVDIDRNKIGRSINGIPVFSDSEADEAAFRLFGIQEIVFAIPGASAERKKELYTRYKATGCRLKTYDYPTTHTVNGKRSLRDFDAEELLFRQANDFLNEETRNYYRGKTVLISGGGGSIGSELSRQIANMQPKKLIILDVYENCAYDIQQELKILYGSDLDLAVEIVTITDKGELEKVFARHKPDVVVHAAAHKHVPLMENNCCEAVKNNVFGTKNLLEVAESSGCGKFIMVSTDKAVNPTNVMGATKRMCEMEVLSHQGNMACSATRFGNVLGSNGSVIPLFKRQIMNGGPVTLTDRRIVRYFMTIPEASQLVLTSGAMAKHGELFVLDMGKPVQILELAENMIRLSGYEPYKDIDIVETGLRPGEKLYEELLVKTEELDKTDNDKIFVERDKPLDSGEIARKLEILTRAVETNDDDICREAMKQVVETYRSPTEVNRKAEQAREMQVALP